MLHTHANIVCASDPFRPFFNCLRDAVARDIGVSVNEFDPLGDYFADKTQLDIFDAVQQTTLNQPFPDDARNKLYNRITSHAEPFSPKIVSQLDAVQGETFRDVYDSLLSHVSTAYGEGNEQWEATKEVWTTEFTPVLAHSYPDSKFLHIIRDPRAVCASKNVQQDTKYPWLFLVRQWRKLAILINQYNNEFSNRVQVVRYEDLVTSPHDTIVDICEFLNIEVDQRLLDPSNFVDGTGEQWLQNTSYEGSQASFNTNSVDKWKDVLTDREINYIEQLSYPEMRLYHYVPETTQFGLSDNLIFNPPRVPREELADWITEYYGSWGYVDHTNAVGTEQLRQQLLMLPDDRFEHIDEQLLKAYFLVPEYAEIARIHS
jgi:hypothetical protein